MPAKSPELRVAVARAGGVARTEDPARIAETRSALATARIAAYIERVVAAAPPLTDDQRSRLALLLAGDES